MIDYVKSIELNIDKETPRGDKKIYFTQHLQGQPCFHKHHYRSQFQSQLHFYVSFITPYYFYIQRVWSAINIVFKNGLRCYICKVNLSHFFLQSSSWKCLTCSADH